MSEDQIKELLDVIFRKIGRNLVNFQQFERPVELIIVRSDVLRLRIEPTTLEL